MPIPVYETWWFEVKVEASRNELVRTRCKDKLYEATLKKRNAIHIRGLGCSSIFQIIRADQVVDGGGRKGSV